MLSTKFHKKLLQALNLRNYWLTPYNHTSADVFLVSYPRSGNTWLRFLVANAIKVHFNLEQEVNFFSIQGIIPDIHISRKVSNNSPFGISTLPRIIKSHSAYNPFYNRVILLVRHPQDVIVSYYHRLIANQTIPPEKYSLKEFIRSSYYGIPAWKKHTESWIFNNRIGQNIQLFTYENITKETKYELSKVMNLLGINMSNDALEKAINLTSKENMIYAEKATRPTQAVKLQNTPFVRKSKINFIQKIETTEEQLIKKETRYILDLIGYEC